MNQFVTNSFDEWVQFRKDNNFADTDFNIAEDIRDCFCGFMFAPVAVIDDETVAAVTKHIDEKQSISSQLNGKLYFLDVFRVCGALKIRYAEVKGKL